MNVERVEEAWQVVVELSPFPALISALSGRVRECVEWRERDLVGVKRGASSEVIEEGGGELELEEISDADSGRSSGMLFTRALTLLLLGLVALTSAFFTDKRKRFAIEKRFLTGFGPSDGTLKFRRGAMDGSLEGGDGSDFSYLMRKTWIG